MQDDEDILTGMRNHDGIPEFVEKGDPTLLGDNVISLGKMAVFYGIGLEWRGTF